MAPTVKSLTGLITTRQRERYGSALDEVIKNLGDSKVKRDELENFEHANDVFVGCEDGFMESLAAQCSESGGGHSTDDAARSTDGSTETAEATEPQNPLERQGTYRNLTKSDLYAMVRQGGQKQRIAIELLSQWDVLASVNNDQEVILGETIRQIDAKDGHTDFRISTQHVAEVALDRNSGEATMVSQIETFIRAPGAMRNALEAKVREGDLHAADTLEYLEQTVERLRVMSDDDSRDGLIETLYRVAAEDGQVGSLADTDFQADIGTVELADADTLTHLSDVQRQAVRQAQADFRTEAQQANSRAQISARTELIGRVISEIGQQDEAFAQMAAEAEKRAQEALDGATRDHNAAQAAGTEGDGTSSPEGEPIKPPETETAAAVSGQPATAQAQAEQYTLEMAEYQPQILSMDLEAANSALETYIVHHRAATAPQYKEPSSQELDALKRKGINPEDVRQAALAQYYDQKQAYDKQTEEIIQKAQAVLKTQRERKQEVKTAQAKPQGNGDASRIAAGSRNQAIPRFQPASRGNGGEAYRNPFQDAMFNYHA